MTTIVHVFTVTQTTATKANVECGDGLLSFLACVQFQTFEKYGRKNHVQFT